MGRLHPTLCEIWNANVGYSKRRKDKEDVDIYDGSSMENVDSHADNEPLHRVRCVDN